MRVRCDDRRIHVVLCRKGWRHGQNKTRRAYRELGLQLRNKMPKRRVKAKLRDDCRPAPTINETWPRDFVSTSRCGAPRRQKIGPMPTNGSA